MAAGRALKREPDVGLRIERGHASRQLLAQVRRKLLRRAPHVTFCGLDDTGREQRSTGGRPAEGRGEVSAGGKSKPDAPAAVLENGCAARLDGRTCERGRLERHLEPLAARRARGTA